MDTNHNQQCPVCQSSNITVFFEAPSVLVYCNVLWPTKEAAMQAPRGDIRLGFCADCEHIFNLDFKPALMDYTQSYENSLHFSPRFQNYAESLARRLIERYNLHNKDIIEIGCGKGDFLKLVCNLEHNRGIGFDRSYAPESDEAESASRVTFVQDFFAEQSAHYPADLIICRHVLEHIPTPVEFLSTIRRVIGVRHNVAVFFEVPNALFTLQDLGIWDIIYEHCSYFTPNSIAHLFQKCEFAINKIDITFAGQFLTVQATPNGTEISGRSSSLITPKTIQKDINTFSASYSNSLNTWREKLRIYHNNNRKVVIWGTGSKGVTFLNALSQGKFIEFAIDINPRKQGKFIPGTGQKIVSPKFLQVYRPDIVIVMNPIYRDEIRQMLTELGLDSEIVLAQDTVF